MFTGPAEMLFQKREFGSLEVTIGNESGNLKLHLLVSQPSWHSNNLSIFQMSFVLLFERSSELSHFL